MGTTIFCDICKKHKEFQEISWNSLIINAENLENTLKIQGITTNLDLCNECGILLIPKVIRCIRDNKKQ